VGLLVPVKDGGTLSAVMEIVKDGKISIAGKPLVYPGTQEYKGITIHPVHIRFNFLLAVTGGYAIVDDTFVLITTLAGLKAVLDTVIGGPSVLTDTNFATNTPGVQIFIQPERAVPELKRFLPLAAVLAALSGQELDAALTQHITANLFPLESLGPTSVVVNVDDQRVDAEVRIVLEE